MRLTFDVETRSPVDLKKSGVYPYAEHPDTEIMCLSYKLGDYSTKIWINPKFEVDYPFPRVTPDQLREDFIAATIISAHNIEFDYTIWTDILQKIWHWFELPFDKLRDIAAKAAMCGLPRSLDGAGEALGLPIQKDKEGHRIMLKLCKPRKPRLAEKRADPKWAEKLYWHEDPADLIKLFAYCITDTEAEHLVDMALPDLPPKELEIWRHNLKVNRRGIKVDTQMAESAVGLIAEYEKILLGEMDALTGGLVQSPRQVAAGLSWLATRGVNLENMQKATVSDALKTNLPADARRFLEIRQSLSKSSTAKYTAAINMVCSDGRIRGLLMYHGAGTGRWAHKGFQPGNLPRGSIHESELENAVNLVKGGSLANLTLEYGDPMPVLSSTIRPLLTASPGSEFICSDYSAVEGRGLAWLAGEETVLQHYRDGLDMYKVAASAILGKPYEDIGKKERKNPGKIAELACGYMGGPRAIAAFGGKCPEEDVPYYTEKLMLKADDTQKREAQLGMFPLEDDIFKAWARDIVTKWRKSRPMTVKFWHGLDNAAIQCVETGQPVNYRSIWFSLWREWLLCTLPNGRHLYYFAPRLANKRMPWGKIKLCVSCMTVDGTTKKWVRRFISPGIYAENVTQAVCRDLLAEANLRVEGQGYPVALHVHDEILSDTPQGHGSLPEFSALMSELPPWAQGFPLSAEGWTGPRFKKD